MIVMQRRFSNVIVTDTETSPTLEAGGGEGGNNLPMIVDTLVFDEAQITSPINGNVPQWGGLCHALSGNAGRTVVIIREIHNAESIQPTEPERGVQGR